MSFILTPFEFIFFLDPWGVSELHLCLGHTFRISDLLSPILAPRNQRVFDLLHNSSQPNISWELKLLKYHKHLTDLGKNLCVSNLRSENGVWDLTPLHGVILDMLLPKIRSLAIPEQSRGRDSVAWSLTVDGSFSNTSAYMSLLDQNLRSPNGVFKRIWG